MQEKTDDELIEDTEEMIFRSLVDMVDHITEILELKETRKITANQACLLIEKTLDSDIQSFP